MKMFLYLFTNEFKRLFSALAMLLFIHLFCILYMLVVTVKPYSIIYRNFNFMIELTFFMAPFFMVFMLRNEWNTRSIYQLLSFPVRRSTVFLAKYASTVIMIVLLYPGMVVWTSLFARNVSVIEINKQAPHILDILTSPLFYLSVSFVIISIALLTEAVRYAVLRHQNFMWGAVFLSGLWLYYNTGINYTSLLETSTLFIWVGFGLKGTLYSFGMGLLFLLTGLVIVEKYGDV